MSGHVVQLHIVCENVWKSTFVDLYDTSIHHCVEKRAGVVVVTFACPLCGEDHRIEIG